jgi:hypothetical protein
MNRLLARVREFEEKIFAVRCGGDLQADGQVPGGQSAWNRNRRDSPDIEWPRVSEQDELARAEKVGVFFQV